MEVFWTKHSKERFFERSLKYGIEYIEVENKIKKQEIKEKQKGGKIKTIFKITDYFFTVIKKETKEWIKVISIWEANENEVQRWRKK